VPAGPVNGLGEAVAEMERATGGWVVEEAGMRLAPSPLHAAGDQLPLRLPPPRLGEHTDEILRAVGIGAAELVQLRARGVIA
jgi:formyl-CoA transferase